MRLLKRHSERRPTPPPFDPASYWADRHAAHVGQLAAVGHRRLSEEKNAAQYEIKRRTLLSAIDRFLPDPRGRTLLDAGCGIGVLSEAFAAHGFEVTGVDFCPSAVEAARKRVSAATFLACPLDQLRLPARFDVISVIDVLLHIIDDAQWDATVVNLADHLKEDALMVIVDSFNEAADKDAIHCRRRPRAAWYGLFDRLDLRVLHHEQFDLPHEGSTKDLVVSRSKKAAH